MRPLPLLVLALLAGCPQPVDDDDAADDDDATAAPDDDDDATSDDDDAIDDDDSGDDDDATPPVGPLAVDPPPVPTPAAVVQTVSVTLVTADVAFAGTDDNQLWLCLTETDCFRLNVADVNDQERGATDRYHFEGLSLDRAAIDRVELRSENGEDRWEPACLAVQLDGLPSHCRQFSGEQFGIEDDELQSWMDPAGLTLSCTACDPEPLTHGPMLGPSEPDAVRVWARTDATRLVGLRLDADADLSDAPVVAWAYPSATNDYAVALTGPLLLPDTTYHYGLEVDGVLQAGPTPVRTAPLPAAPEPLRFAYGSCSKFDEQPIFDTIAAEEPDLFLFVGDNHYGNTDVVDALRWNYRHMRAIPPRRNLIGRTPTLATWDDHDFTGNNTDATEPGRGDALRVFGEYWANPSAGTPATPGTFFAHQHGAVDFFFVDDRYHRGLDDSILGAPQQQWLIDQLLDSTATFKFVVCGSRWTAEGSNDSWASFLEQRDVIFDALADAGVTGVVLLSGDIHRSDLRWIDRPGAYALPELTSSPLANLSGACSPDAEQVGCYSGISFVLVDVDPSAPDPTLSAVVLDEAGDVRVELTTTLSELSD
jgi:alkaline phosphatase D